MKTISKIGNYSLKLVYTEFKPFNGLIHVSDTQNVELYDKYIKLQNILKKN